MRKFGFGGPTLAAGAFLLAARRETLEGAPPRAEAETPEETHNGIEETTEPLKGPFKREELENTGEWLRGVLLAELKLLFGSLCVDDDDADMIGPDACLTDCGIVIAIGVSAALVPPSVIGVIAHPRSMSEFVSATGSTKSLTARLCAEERKKEKEPMAEPTSGILEAAGYKFGPTPSDAPVGSNTGEAQRDSGMDVSPLLYELLLCSNDPSTSVTDVRPKLGGE